MQTILYEKLLLAESSPSENPNLASTEKRTYEAAFGDQSLSAVPTELSGGLIISSLKGERVAIIKNATVIIFGIESDYSTALQNYNLKQREIKFIHGQWSDDGLSLAVYNQASRSVLLLESGLISYEWKCSSWGTVVGLVAVPGSQNNNAPGPSAVPKFLAICEGGQVLCLSKAQKPTLVSRLFALLPKATASSNWLWKWGSSQSIKAVSIHNGKNPILAVVSEGQVPEPTTSQAPSARVHSLDDSEEATLHSPLLPALALSLFAIEHSDKLLELSLLSHTALPAHPPSLGSKTNSSAGKAAAWSSISAAFSPEGSRIAINAAVRSERPVSALTLVSVTQAGRGLSAVPLPLAQPKSLLKEGSSAVVSLCWWSEQSLLVAFYGGALQLLPFSRDLSADLGPETSRNLLGLEPERLSTSFPALAAGLLSAGNSKTPCTLILENHSQRDWSLLCLVERSPEWMLETHLGQQEYGLALSLARTFALDEDLVRKKQWEDLRLAGTWEGPSGTIPLPEILARVQDKAWAVVQCTDSRARTLEGAKALLSWGLSLTEPFRDSADKAAGDASARWFLKQRLRLVQYGERLDTYLGISRARFNPAEYYGFRSEDLLELAFSLTSRCEFTALEALLDSHPFSVGIHLLTVLEAVPESTSPHQYRSLLPPRKKAAGARAERIRAADWAESPAVVQAAQEEGEETLLTENMARMAVAERYPGLLQTADTLLLPAGLTQSSDLVLWYQNRCCAMDASTGLLENVMALLSLGLSKGLQELQEDLSQLRDLHALTFNCSTDSGTAGEISVAEWLSMDAYSQLCFMLPQPLSVPAGAESRQGVKERVTEVALPFAQRQAAAESGTRLLQRWVQERAQGGDLEACRVLLEAMAEAEALHPAAGTPADSEDELDSNSSLALGLLALHSCQDTSDSAWVAMEEILALVAPQSASDSAERESAGTRKWRETCFHVKGARILAKYEVPVPMSFFAGDLWPEKSFLEREAAIRGRAVDVLARMVAQFGTAAEAEWLQGGSFSSSAWCQLWEDLDLLSTCVFPQLGRRTGRGRLDLQCQLVAYLLRMGQLALAESFMQDARMQEAELLAGEAEDDAGEVFYESEALGAGLSWKRKEKLVLETAQELFFSAQESVTREVHTATSLLSLLGPHSQAGSRLECLITAVTHTLPSLGVHVSPNELRPPGAPAGSLLEPLGEKEALRLLDLALSSSPEAFRDPPTLLSLGNLLGLSAAHVLTAVGLEAFERGDLPLALSLAKDLTAQGHQQAWNLCEKVAQQVTRGKPESADCSCSCSESWNSCACSCAAAGCSCCCSCTSSQLLAFAMAYCPPSALPELMAEWQAAFCWNRCSQINKLATESASHIHGQSLPELFSVTETLSQEQRREKAVASLAHVSPGMSDWTAGSLPAVHEQQLVEFGSVFVPWLLAVLREEGISGVLQSQCAALLLHCCASLPSPTSAGPLPPSAPLLLGMADWAMKEGLQCGQGEEGDSVALGYILHLSAGSISAGAAPVELEKAWKLLLRQAELRSGSNKDLRRSHVMAMLYAALQAWTKQKTAVRSAAPATGTSAAGLAQQLHSLLLASPWDALSAVESTVPKVAAEPGSQDQSSPAFWIDLALSKAAEVDASEDLQWLADIISLPVSQAGQAAERSLLTEGASLESGVDLQRFVAREEPYMAAVLLAMVATSESSSSHGSPVWPVKGGLSRAVLLAERYSLDPAPAKLRFLEAVLVASSWQSEWEEEMEELAEVEGLVQEMEKQCPLLLLQKLQGPVFEDMNPEKLSSLALFFSLLARAYRAVSRSASAAETLQTALFPADFPAVDRAAVLDKYSAFCRSLQEATPAAAVHVTKLLHCWAWNGTSAEEWTECIEKALSASNVDAMAAALEQLEAVAATVSPKQALLSAGLASGSGTVRETVFSLLANKLLSAGAGNSAGNVQSIRAVYQRIQQHGFLSKLSSEQLTGFWARIAREVTAVAPAVRSEEEEAVELWSAMAADCKQARSDRGLHGVAEDLTLLQQCCEALSGDQSLLSLGTAPWLWPLLSHTALALSVTSAGTVAVPAAAAAGKTEIQVGGRSLVDTLVSHGCPLPVLVLLVRRLCRVTPEDKEVPSNQGKQQLPVGPQKGKETAVAAVAAVADTDSAGAAGRGAGRKGLGGRRGRGGRGKLGVVRKGAGSAAAAAASEATKAEAAPAPAPVTAEVSPVAAAVGSAEVDPPVQELLGVDLDLAVVYKGICVEGLERDGQGRMRGLLQSLAEAEVQAAVARAAAVRGLVGAGFPSVLARMTQLLRSAVWEAWLTAQAQSTEMVLSALEMMEAVAPAAEGAADRLWGAWKLTASVAARVGEADSRLRQRLMLLRCCQAFPSPAGEAAVSAEDLRSGESVELLFWRLVQAAGSPAQLQQLSAVLEWAQAEFGEAGLPHQAETAACTEGAQQWTVRALHKCWFHLLCLLEESSLWDLLLSILDRSCSWSSSRGNQVLVPVSPEEGQELVERLWGRDSSVSLVACKVALLLPFPALHDQFLGAGPPVDSLDRDTWLLFIGRGLAAGAAGRAELEPIFRGLMAALSESKGALFGGVQDPVFRVCLTAAVCQLAQSGLVHVAATLVTGFEHRHPSLLTRQSDVPVVKRFLEAQQEQLPAAMAATIDCSLQEHKRQLSQSVGSQMTQLLAKLRSLAV